jgi:hypothetical protein
LPTVAANTGVVAGVGAEAGAGAILRTGAARAAAAEVIGLGPEDPLADIAAAGIMIVAGYKAVQAIFSSSDSGSNSQGALSKGASAAAGAPPPEDDESGDKKTNDKAKSPNQLNNDIKQGNAPKGVDRVDVGKVKGEQTHVHFDDDSALNKDGTWKHGERDLTRAQEKWLVQNGWNLPK